MTRDERCTHAGRAEHGPLRLQVLQTYGSEALTLRSRHVKTMEYGDISFFGHLEIHSQRLADVSPSHRAHRGEKIFVASLKIETYRGLGSHARNARTKPGRGKCVLYSRSPFRRL